MNREEAKARLIRQRDLIESLLYGRDHSLDFTKWRRDTEIAIQYIFGKDTRHLKDFTDVKYTPGVWSSSNADAAFQSAYQGGLARARSVLDSMVNEIEEYWHEDSIDSPFEVDDVSVIEKLCNRFHLVARQLRSRHDKRTTLQVEDEYDVQDLLHALLKIHFDDVRPEEWTPSYAGKSARTDFLLKAEKIIVEVKKTRQSLGEKEVSDQLIIDITRYKSHPDCQKLVCFVYDPEGRIGNPRSIEKDLTGKHNDLDVLVLVAPKGL